MAEPRDAQRKQEVLDALKRVIDPELGVDIVSLGFIENLTAEDDRVSFRLVLTTPACPMRDRLRREAEQAVQSLPWAKQVRVDIGARVPAPQRPGNLLPGVRNIVAVGSGKGGVGKTTVAVNLAVALAREGGRVGLLDGDIYGPNVPRMLGVSRQPEVVERKIVPLEAHGLRLMSIGFLIEESSPVIWRGPLIHKAVEQFLSDVDWGELDYLLVDLPPGTGDVQLSLTQLVSVTGAVLVSTPQPVALNDTLRGLEMFRRASVPILGMIENMSYFICPHCGKETDIFGRGAVRDACKRLGIQFLGDIPLSPSVRESGDTGLPVALAQDPEGERFRDLACRLAGLVSVAAIKSLPQEGQSP